MASKQKFAVIGLGYVGLTTAIAFSKKNHVIAYDKSAERINELKQQYDKNNEVSKEELANKNIYLTNQASDLAQANFYIISVPTPINEHKQPDLSLLLAAAELVAGYLKKGDIVVFESTVYPGVTEDICIPLLERVSKLTRVTDFSVGFSPERINPADKEHTFYTVKKIVSATDDKALSAISEAYDSVVDAGVYPVSAIKVAEAAKIIENIQRDINIAYVNDIAILLHTLGIDSTEVFDAMKTKWNALPFKPGLVGGHCIGVNAHYLINKAEEVGHHADLIAAGRRINESIENYIVSSTVKQLINKNILVKNARVAVLGITYKENCVDVRDTRVTDIINELKSYGINPLVYDPVAEAEQVKNEYGIQLQPTSALNHLDAIIIAVAHEQFMQFTRADYEKMLAPHGVIIDVKSICHPEDFANTSITLWRL